MITKDKTLSNILKKALVGNYDARFIFINNFEVEEHWVKEKQNLSLPKISLGSSRAIVNRMEQLGIFIADNSDFLILNENLEDGYIKYLEKIGMSIPDILTIEENDPNLNITENILRCSMTIEKLKNMPKKDLYLLPFGVSKKEEELSMITGIPLALPSSNTFIQVNEKSYSRTVNRELGIKQIKGYECSDLQELSNGFNKMKNLLNENKKIVMKESLGVSGKGIVIIDSENKFSKYLRIIANKLEKNKNVKVNFVLEEWIEKVCDLNYQFLIDRKGGIDFHFIKESLVKNNVHQGHVIPSRLTQNQIYYLECIAKKLGEKLYEDGYYGIVGVDAILDKNNVIWPNLEINARFNMSTYQTNIQNQFILDNQFALAKKYDLVLKDKVNLNDLINALGEYNFNSKSGFIINNFATVNAAYSTEKKKFSGRLYGVLIGNSNQELAKIDDAVNKAISLIEGGV